MLRGVDDVRVLEWGCLAPYLLSIELFEVVYSLIHSYLYHTVGQ
jgi:hypothetical protein